MSGRECFGVVFLAVCYNCGNEAVMRFNIKALAFTVSVVWAASILLTGLANLIWTGYATAFLEAVASLYPGYQAAPSFGEVIVGTLYGLLDGFVAGLVFGWLYNLFVAGSAA